MDLSQEVRLFSSGRARKTDFSSIRLQLYSKKHSLECPWFDMFPAIRGVQDHMSNWMSNLIQAQDGCLQMVAQRATMGRVQQEQLPQNIAQRAMMPSTSDQVSYLRAQLAHREAQLEQVRAERDNHFVQEEEVLAHMRLLSSEAKDWKSRVVTEAEEVLSRKRPSRTSSYRSTRGH